MLFRCPNCSYQGNPVKWLLRTRDVFKLKNLSEAAKHPIYVCPYCGTEMRSSQIHRLGQ